MDGRRIRNNKVAFSNLSGIVWTGPKRERNEGLAQIATNYLPPTRIIHDLSFLIQSEFTGSKRRHCKFQTADGKMFAKLQKGQKLVSRSSVLFDLSWKLVKVLCPSVSTNPK